MRFYDHGALRCYPSSSLLPPATARRSPGRRAARGGRALTSTSPSNRGMIGRQCCRAMPLSTRCVAFAPPTDRGAVCRSWDGSAPRSFRGPARPRGRDDRGGRSPTFTLPPKIEALEAIYNTPRKAPAPHDQECNPTWRRPNGPHRSQMNAGADAHRRSAVMTELMAQIAQPLCTDPRHPANLGTDRRNAHGHCRSAQQAIYWEQSPTAVFFFLLWALGTR